MPNNTNADLKALAGAVIEQRETEEGENKLKNFCTFYKQSSRDEKSAFLHFLAKEFYIDRSQFESAAESYLNNHVSSSGA